MLLKLKRPDSQTVVVNSVKRLRNRKMLIGMALVALLAIAGGVGYFLYQQQQQPKVDANSIVIVKREPLDVTITATGVIRPDKEVKISPKTSGLIKQLLVEQGQYVQQNQVIAQMDQSNLVGPIQRARGAVLIAKDNYQKALNGNRPQEIAAASFQAARAAKAVQQARQQTNRVRANIKAMTAQVERDEANARRQTLLSKEGAVSAQDALNAETASRVARSQLEASEQELIQTEQAIQQAQADFEAVKEQRSLMNAGSRVEDISAAKHTVYQTEGDLQTLLQQLEDTRVRAPFPGIITQKYAELGAFVTPTTSAATTSATSSSIVALAGDLELVAQVPEVNIAQIRLQQPVQITATAFPDKVFNAHVSRIAPEAIVTQNVTTFEVRAVLDRGSAQLLRSGMNVSVRFIVGTEKNAMTVPTVAVISRRNRTGVFVPDAKGQPVFREVKTGATVGSRTIVVSGLKEGDKVFRGLTKEQMQSNGYGSSGPGGRGGFGAMGVPGMPGMGGAGGGRRGGGGAR